MRTKSIAVCLVLLISFQLYGQKTDLKRQNLNGIVTSIRELTYRAVSTNGEIQKGEMLYCYLNTFDQRGNKITDNKYNPDGKWIKSMNTVTTVPETALNSGSAIRTEVFSGRLSTLTTGTGTLRKITAFHRRVNLKKNLPINATAGAM